jgi:hypothetical protein
VISTPHEGHFPQILKAKSVKLFFATLSTPRPDQHQHHNVFVNIKRPLGKCFAHHFLLTAVLHLSFDGTVCLWSRKAMQLALADLLLEDETANCLTATPKPNLKTTRTKRQASMQSETHQSTW